MTNRSGAMHRMTKEVKCLHIMTSERGVFAQDDYRKWSICMG